MHALVTVLGLAGLLAPAAAAAQDKKPELFAKVGFAGHARAGYWSWVHTQVHARAEDFDGEVRVEVMNSFGSETLRSELRVPVRQRGQRSAYFVAQGPILPAIEVHAVSFEESSSEPVRRPLSLVPKQVALIVYVDTPYEELEDSRLLSVQVNSAELPNRYEAWLAADVVVWAPDSKVRDVTPAAMDALLRWVRAGGTLVLAAGENAFACRGTELEDLLPGTPAEMVELESLGDLAVQWDAPDLELSVQPFRPRDRVFRAEVVNEVSGTPLLWRQRLGSGQVFTLGFDVGRERVRSWAGMRRLIPDLALAARSPEWKLGRLQRPGSIDHADPFEPAQLPAGLLRSLEDFAFFVPIGTRDLLLLFGIYILIVGPVEYLLLRFLHRAHWSLWTTPLAALVLAMVILSSVWNRQARALHTHTASWVTLDCETDDATHVGLTSLYFPSGGRFQLESSGSFALLHALPLPVMEGELFRSTSEESVEQTTHGMQRTISAFAHSVRTAGTSWRGSSEACLDIDVLTTIAERRLSNASPFALKQLVLRRADGSHFWLDDVAAGESIPIVAEPDRALDPATFAELTWPPFDDAPPDAAQQDIAAVAWDFLRVENANLLRLRPHVPALNHGFQLATRLGRDVIYACVEGDPLPLQVDGEVPENRAVCFLRLLLPRAP